ncbi:hypothetical protein HYV56_02275 [Candidatus Peregrinibacteria bacterium]|nr:hypothetical protein [Candidatus Peregrinibacteria bacterium]
MEERTIRLSPTEMQNSFAQASQLASGFYSEKYTTEELFLADVGTVTRKSLTESEKIVFENVYSFCKESKDQAAIIKKIQLALVTLQSPII